MIDLPDPDRAMKALNDLTVAVAHPSDEYHRYDRENWSVDWPKRVNDFLGRDSDNCRLAFYGQVEHCQGLVNPQYDHLVAVAEAYKSGGHAWDTERKRAFYVYLPNLWVLEGRENDEKGDKDPAGWTPTRNGCRYAREWIAVKAHWGLTVDSAEKEALRGLLLTQGKERRL